MAGYGLLFLTQATSLLRENLASILKFVSPKLLRRKLLVSLDAQCTTCPREIYSLVTTCYTTAHATCPSEDVRLILGNLKIPENLERKELEVFPERFLDNVGIAFTDSSQGQARLRPLLGASVELCLWPGHATDRQTDGRTFKAAVTDNAQHHSIDAPLGKMCEPSKIVTDTQTNGQPLFTTNVTDLARHDGVVLGGTFDRLHNGHKILLSASALMAKRNVTVGVTEGAMLHSKLLYELIEPVESRIAEVNDFLMDIDDSLEYKVVPIIDPFGPSIVDANLDAIVASAETERGARKVCQLRVENGLNDLDVYLVCLAPDDDPNRPPDEPKISSSTQRRQLLGTLLRPRSPPLVKPYVIGLTGGIASGKSNIAKYLHSLGAHLIDCDKLGHKAYAKDTDCFHKLVARFGNDIVDPKSDEIDRRTLGPLVFSSEDARRDLNNIVWPEIARLAKDEITNAKQRLNAAGSNGPEVIVLDAAVLLEAGWDSFVDEVWVTLIPRDEAIRRVTERNKLTSEEAVKRIDAQMDIREKVARASVAFCSLWDYEMTRAQVRRSWDQLVKDLGGVDR